MLFCPQPPTKPKNVGRNDTAVCAPPTQYNRLHLSLEKGANWHQSKMWQPNWDLFCLEELVLDAPQLFQCAISSQLMMDPVQTPEASNVTALMHMCSFDLGLLDPVRVLKTTHTAELVQWLSQGFMMERTVLVEALRASGGLCPLSGRLLITWLLSKHGRMSNLVDDAFAAVLHNVLSCQMVTLRRIGKTCLNFSYVAFLDTYFNKALLVNVGVAIRTPQTYTHTNTYIYIYTYVLWFSYHTVTTWPSVRGLNINIRCPLDVKFGGVWMVRRIAMV